jgi:DNA-binding transcriptional LysR family regulator
LPDTIAMVPLGREVFHAVMPRQHRLAPSRGVTMKQIGREPLVSLPNDSRTRRTIDAAASKQGITDEGAVSRGEPSWLCLGRSSERNCGTGMIMRRFAPDSALEEAVLRRTRL